MMWAVSIIIATDDTFAFIQDSVSVAVTVLAFIRDLILVAVVARAAAREIRRIAEGADRDEVDAEDSVVLAVQIAGIIDMVVITVRDIGTMGARFMEWNPGIDRGLGG